VGPLIHPPRGGVEYSKISSFEGDNQVIREFDERGVRYGEADSMGGLFDYNEGKGKKGKEAHLNRLL